MAPSAAKMLSKTDFCHTTLPSRGRGLALHRRCRQPPLKMIERLPIVSTGRSRLFQVPVAPYQFGQTRVLNTHAPTCPIAVSYPNRGRTPPRRPTRSGPYVLLRPLLCRQRPCQGRRFAADNRQNVYRCSSDFCMLRRQSPQRLASIPPSKTIFIADSLKAHRNSRKAGAHSY
jgi:hypothetical protein